MERVRPKDIVTEEGYTLPSFLLRNSSAAVDIAICFAVIALFFVFIYPFGFMPTLGDAMGISETTHSLNTYKLASKLYTNELGLVTDKAFDNYEGYQKTVEDYYLVYQKEGNVENPAPKCYDVSTYNVKVLYLPESVDFIVNSPYFEFALDANNKPDPTKIGVIRPSLLEKDGSVGPELKQNLLYFFQKRYSESVNEFDSEPYMVDLIRKNVRLTVTAEMLAIMPPFAVFYIVLPLTDQWKRRTIGKRIMKLACIDVKGGALPWYFVLLRAVPFVLLTVSAFLFDDLVVTSAILITGFLVSLGFATFSSKRRALHDFLAHSVVAKDDASLFEAKEENNGN